MVKLPGTFTEPECFSLLPAATHCYDFGQTTLTQPLHDDYVPPTTALSEILWRNCKSALYREKGKHYQTAQSNEQATVGTHRDGNIPLIKIPGSQFHAGLISCSVKFWYKLSAL